MMQNHLPSPCCARSRAVEPRVPSPKSLKTEVRNLPRHHKIRNKPKSGPKVAQKQAPSVPFCFKSEQTTNKKRTSGFPKKALPNELHASNLANESPGPPNGPRPPSPAGHLGTCKQTGNGQQQKHQTDPRRPTNTNNTTYTATAQRAQQLNRPTAQRGRDIVQ
jgi:hypothetical protein